MRRASPGERTPAASRSCDRARASTGAATTLTLPRVLRRQPDPKNAVKTQSGLGDTIFFNLTRLAALLTLFVLAGIIVSLVISSWPSIQKFGFSFLTETTWDPQADKFGALVPIYGTS